MGRSFFGRASDEGRERERAVGGRRRHQLLDRRANDRLYMQTPPADFGSAIFVSVKQKKNVSRAAWMSSIRSGDQTFSETDFVVNKKKKKGKYFGFEAVVGGLLLPGDRWSGGRSRRRCDWPAAAALRY